MLKFIDNMPMSIAKITPKNLSLYENYNEKSTVKGLGFKNKEKALYTLNKIKNKPLSYQKRVVTTMIYRAKYHPKKTKNMDNAIKIFLEWKKNKNKK